MAVPPPRGFTLVEVLVALTIMAVLAAMSFRGIDALSHAREGAQGATDRTLKLNSGMSQFEYDMSQMIDTQVVYPIDFHGSTLRITRRTPAGVVLVVWAMEDGRWQRWASQPLVRITDLQDAWMRTQQWTSISDGAVTVLDDVSDFQVYCYRGGWSNCESTGNIAAAGEDDTVPNIPGGGTAGSGTAAGAVSGSPSGAANGGTNTGGAGGVTPTNGGTTNANKQTTAAPTGIQIVLKLPGGTLLRERELPPI